MAITLSRRRGHSIRRLLAVLPALLVALALAVPAPAPGTGGTDQSGQTGRTPTKMPATGAGGLPGSSLPVAAIALVLWLLGAGPTGC